MKPQPKKFTRGNICTRRLIWNCFRGRRGFVPVQVAIVESQIGINVPADMIVQRRLYLFYESTDQGEAEYYELTESGEEWLLKGIVGHLKLHPDEYATTNNLPHHIRQQLPNKVRSS